MTWKHGTTEQWMKIAVVALFIVGVVCTLIIVLARLK
jgi:hypothetical protein